MKEKEYGFIKGVVIAILAAFILICGASFTLCFLQIKKNPSCDFRGVEVSGFIAFLTLAFAISIATPYFITKNKVETVVRRYFKRDIGPDIINRSDEIAKLDAHLSRMVAFNLLQQKYYYWAVGWSFRSLKRYSELKESYSDLYKEFHDFVFNRIILVALKAARTDKENALFVAENVGEEEAFNIKIRAVKDYVDFLYLIKEHGEENSIRKLKSEFFNQIDEIKREMNFLIREFYKIWFKPNGCYRGTKCVDDYFFSASRYKDNSIKLRNFFYENIWASIDDSGFPELEDCEEFQSYRNKINKKYKEN